MRSSPYATLGVWVLLGGAFAACAQAGDAFEYTGFNDLMAELGGATPTGANVPVMLVEANVDNDLLTGDGDPSNDHLPTDGAYDFTPDLDSPQFFGKTFTIYIPPDTSGADESTHSNVSARGFFGNTLSTSPGVTAIEVYEANHWLGDGQIRFESPSAPAASPEGSRIGSHSYIGSTGDPTTNLHVIQRVDWLIHTDEFVQVVGSTGSVPIHQFSFNAVRAGRMDALGIGPGSTTALPGPVYVAGRTVRDVVAIEGTASSATPKVASVAALLIETAHANPGLSNGSVVDRGAQTIYHGETAEVVKALLMAGADRRLVTATATGGPAYAIDSTNGLSHRYGAGVVNVYNAYHMLAAGERDSIEDGGPIDAGRYGFDYDSAFGGGGGSNATATYAFSASADIDEFAASLVWHVDVDINDVIDDMESSAAELYNLDLTLFRVTGGGNVLVEDSLSTIENTENIWIEDLAAGDYLLVVTATGAPFEWDYGIAWRATVVPAPGSLATALGVAPLLLRRRRRGSPEAGRHGTV